MTDITNVDDIIDSRDILEYIEKYKDDKDFEERFALKVKPDTRMRQVRHFKPSVIQKLKAMKKDMKTSIISTDQFNNKKQKQNKEKKNDR